MPNHKLAGKSGGRRGPVAAWAAALLFAWPPFQGSGARAETVPSTRPPDHAPVQTLTVATAPVVGNPDSDPDVEVSGPGKGEASEVFLAAHKDVVMVSWVAQG